MAWVWERGMDHAHLFHFASFQGDMQGKSVGRVPELCG